MVPRHEDTGLMIRTDALIQLSRKGHQDIQLSTSKHQACQDPGLWLPSHQSYRKSPVGCKLPSLQCTVPTAQTQGSSASRSPFLPQSLIQGHGTAGFMLHKCKSKLHNAMSHPSDKKNKKNRCNKCWRQAWEHIVTPALWNAEAGELPWIKANAGCIAISGLNNNNQTYQELVMIQMWVHT